MSLHKLANCATNDSKYVNAAVIASVHCSLRLTRFGFSPHGMTADADKPRNFKRNRVEKCYLITKVIIPTAQNTLNWMTIVNLILINSVIRDFSDSNRRQYFSQQRDTDSME